MVILCDLEAPLVKASPEGSTRSTPSSFSASFWQFLKVLGPGLVVCLADGDPGGLTMMAVDGAETRFGMLSLQLALIPVLYTVQEMVVRLTVLKGQGLLALVRSETGPWAAGVFTAAMTIEGVISMVSEFSGIAAAGEILGLSREASCLGGGVLLLVIVLASDYKMIERMGMCLGSCTLVFVVTAFMCSPPWGEVARNIVPGPDTTKVPASMIWANVGTVVTPWMLFYQGSAIVVKGVGPKDLNMERADTAVGSVVTQMIMCSILITFAVMAPGSDLEHAKMRNVFTPALEPLLGEALSKVVICSCLLGTGLLSAMVISLGVAWNLTECAGGVLSARDATTTPTFRKFFVGTVVFGVVFVNSHVISIVSLNIYVQMVDGFFMPLVVSYIFYLATSKRILPEEHRVQGPRKIIIGLLLAACSALALEQAGEGVVAVLLEQAGEGIVAVPLE